MWSITLVDALHLYWAFVGDVRVMTSALYAPGVYRERRSETEIYNNEHKNARFFNLPMKWATRTRSSRSASSWMLDLVAKQPPSRGRRCWWRKRAQRGAQRRWRALRDRWRFERTCCCVTSLSSAALWRDQTKTKKQNTRKTTTARPS